MSTEYQLSEALTCGHIVADQNKQVEPHSTAFPFRANDFCEIAPMAYLRHRWITQANAHSYILVREELAFGISVTISILPHQPAADLLAVQWQRHCLWQCLRHCSRVHLQFRQAMVLTRPYSRLNSQSTLSKHQDSTISTRFPIAQTPHTLSEPVTLQHYPRDCGTTVWPLERVSQENHAVMELVAAAYSVSHP